MRKIVCYQLTWLFLAYATVISLGVYVLERRFHFGLRGTDDANIFFRYSDNVLRGRGLVYDPMGEAVEGFTSALWLSVCTYARVFREHSETILLVINGALASATCALVTLGTSLSLRRLALNRTILPLFIATAGLALGHPAWLVWNVTSLMDAGLYAFAIALAWFGLQLLVSQRRESLPVLGWATFLLVLCRPEGVGWVFLIAILIEIQRRINPKQTSLVTSAERRVALVGLSTCSLLYAWRWYTFHLLLPNPLYAKVSAPAGQRIFAGTQYLRSYLDVHGFVLLLVLASTVTVVVVECLLVTRKNVVPWWRLPALMDAGGTLLFLLFAWSVPFFAGGDVFGGHRFCQNVHLLLIHPVGIGVGCAVSLLLRARLGARIGRRAVGLLVAVPAFTPIAGISERWQLFGYSNGESGGSFQHFEHVRSEFAIAAADRQHGERIGAVLAAFNPRIAYAAAGGIGVGYAGTIYDMMGLNDPVLARRCRNKVGPTGHACFERERFYELLPDALLPRAASKRQNVDLKEVDAALRRRDNWDNVIFRNLFNEKDFTEQYRMARLVPDEGEFTVYGYFSVRFLLEVAKDRHIRMMFQ